MSTDSNDTNTVNHPEIPYAADIPDGLFPQKAIVIKGSVRDGPTNRFNIDFCCGRLIQGDHRDDVALHFNPRFPTGKSGWFSGKPENVIVLNSLQNNTWGMEHRVANSLEIGAAFTLRILVLRDYFKLTLNGKHLADFIHRLPIERIKCIYIDGCVGVEQIDYQGQASKPPTPLESPSANADGVIPVDVFRPTTPFSHKIGIGGFVPPRQLKVSGTPKMSAKRFEINLMAGTEHLLHFRVDLPTASVPKGFVVRNSTENGKWMEEERDIPFYPFNVGHTVDIGIFARKDYAEVVIDGRAFAVFRWRNIPPQMATSLNVSGEFIIQSVRYS